MKLHYRVFIVSCIINSHCLSATELDVIEVEGEQDRQSPSSHKFGEIDLAHHDELMSLNNALNLESSVNLYQNGRRSSLNVRGLGFTGGPPNPGIEPTNSLYVDGVYIPRTHFLSNDFIPIENITITKSAISSPNSSGIGNVMIETKSADFSGDDFFVETGTGENDYFSLGIGGNKRVSENSAARYLLFKKQNEGIYTNNYNNKKVNFVDVEGGYLKHKWQPSDTLSFDTFLYLLNDNSDWIGSGRANAYMYNPAQRFFFDISLPVATAFAGQMPELKSIYLPTNFEADKVSNDLPNETEVTNRLANISISYQSGELKLTNRTSIIESNTALFTDTDNTNFNLGNQDIGESFRWLSEDVSLTYSSESLEIKNGVYFAESRSDYKTVNYAGDDLLYLRAFISTSPEQRKYFLDFISSSSGYGRSAPVDSFTAEDRTEYTYYFSVAPFSKLDMDWSIGGRYSLIDKKLYKYHSGLCSFSTAHLPSNECTPTSLFFVDKYYFNGNISTEETGYSWYIKNGHELWGLAYLELTYSNVKKIGGYSQTQSIGAEEGYASSIESLYYQPEFTESLTLDFSTPISQINTLASLSVFHTTVNDYQLSYYDGLGFYTTNAEKVSSTGIEMAFNSGFFESVDWNTSASYSKAYYIKNTSGPCPPEEFRTLNNCNYLSWDEASENGDTLRSDLSREDLRSPRLNLSSMLKFHLYYSSQIESNFTIEYSYTGGSRTTEFVHGDFEREGFSIWNLYFQIITKTSGFSLIAEVQNATDKEVKLIEFASPIIRKISNIPGGMNAFMYPRRKFNLLLRYSF